jgi:hypothetical protein
LDAVDTTIYFETRSLPALTCSYPRHFTFYVAHPTRSIRWYDGKRTNIKNLMPAKHQTSNIKPQTSASRVADREKLPLLLDKARQFAGEYIDSLEERPVFPGEKSLRAMDALVEPLPENSSDPFSFISRNPFCSSKRTSSYFSVLHAGRIPAVLVSIPNDKMT